MTKAEVAKLFEFIVLTYPTFTGDKKKIELWHDLLENILFEQAKTNLRRYALNPDNQYPPHPGVLAERGSAEKYTPNVEETRRMWESEPAINPVPPTEEQRERVRRLGTPSH